MELATGRLAGKRQMNSDLHDVFDREWDAGQRSSLSVSDYLAAAAERFWQTPDGFHEPCYHTPVFDFVRAAKCHPELNPLTAERALARVEEWLRQQRKNWTEVSSTVNSNDEAQAEFLVVWDKIRVLPGQSSLAWAIEQAGRQRLIPPNGRPAGYCLFISVAGWLQQWQGNKPILLPVHKLAAVLNCKPMTVSRYRELAIKDGLLEKISDHSYKHKQATEFRFAVGRYPQLQVRHDASIRCRGEG